MYILCNDIYIYANVEIYGFYWGEIGLYGDIHIYRDSIGAIWGNGILFLAGAWGGVGEWIPTKSGSRAADGSNGQPLGFVV